MSSRKKRRPPNQPPCREVGSDDGIDPRTYFRPAADDRRRDRKVLQLCAQVGRAVTYALDGMVADERLAALEVQRVEPAPDARRLRVVLQLRGTPHATHRELTACVEHAQSRLRHAVADAIRRRRVPDLVFEIHPAAGSPA